MAVNIHYQGFINGEEGMHYVYTTKFKSINASKAEIHQCSAPAKGPRL